MRTFELEPLLALLLAALEPAAGDLLAGGATAEAAHLNTPWPPLPLLSRRPGEGEPTLLALLAKRVAPIR